MANALKRKLSEMEDKQSSESISPKEECPHGNRCYRKNPHHFREYAHSHLNPFLDKGDDISIPSGMPQPKDVYLDQIKILKGLLNMPFTTNKPSSSSNSLVETSNVPKKVLKTTANTMIDKLKRCPHNLFFTTIPKSPDTLKYYNSITFTDLICPSLGKLKKSLQINFMLDVSWLLEQYEKVGVHKTPLTIVCSDEFPDMNKYIARFCPHVALKFVKMKDPFGCHHSKVGIYVYEDNSVRVVVSTANLYYEDWNHYNQGVWLSPACPQLPSEAPQTDGESVTGFKKSLLTYLKSYQYEILNDWISIVNRADFSAVKVFLVMSTPGRHSQKSDGCHLTRVGDLLSRHCVLPAKSPETGEEGPLSWPVLAQSSSIGSMGNSPAEWLRGTLLRCLASHSKSALPNSSNCILNLIYPSVDNVANGYFGLESGGCLPYSKATHEKQKWLHGYFHQWKADKLNRTRAMPHIKSYCRVSPCLTKLAYFLLTSANMSKSAWGGKMTKGGTTYVRSYEVGVLFIPKFFDEQYFQIDNETFPFMYDLPLIEYKSSDYPWCN